MASEVKTTISEAVKDAMRARDKLRVGVLRMMMSEFKKIEVDERIELDDTRVIAVLDKQLKQRKDSAKQFGEAGRDDLAAQENLEIEIIQAFMPVALTEAEITQVLEDAIAKTGAETMKDMGKVMAIVKPQIQGRADMGAVSKRVKSLLN